MKEQQAYELLAAVWLILACVLPKDSPGLRIVCIALSALNGVAAGLLIIQRLASLLTN